MERRKKYTETIFNPYMLNSSNSMSYHTQMVYIVYSIAGTCLKKVIQKSSSGTF